MYIKDHGWCFGRLCYKRLSTFFAAIAPNINYDIYLTYVPPTTTRFRILNADSNFKIRLSMFYYSSKRIDLYRNGVNIAPTNAYLSQGQILLRNYTNSSVPSYMPSIANASGTNFFYNRQIYFTMQASDLIEIKIAPVLSLAFGMPPLTPAQFFEPATVVRNFALLLGIPASKIRTVNIVKATYKRRRRNTDEITISLEIYDDPVELLNNATGFNLTNTQQAELGASIVNLFATGQLQDNALNLFNTSLLSLTARQPLASPNSSEVSIGKIDKLIVLQAADLCSAQVPCRQQPILQVVDEYVNHML